MDIKYLSVKNVLYIHEKILEYTLEDKHLSPDKSIDSALNRISDHLYYADLQDIYEIAALYAIAIAKGHCFNNGNKRTGMISMVVFLSINGIELNVNNKEIEDKIVEVVENQINQPQLAQWLKNHVKL